MHQAQEPVRKAEAPTDPVRDILTLPAFTTPSWIAFRLHLLYPWVPKVWNEQDPLLKRLAEATPPQEQDAHEDWDLRLRLAHMDTIFHGLTEDEVRATLHELGFTLENPTTAMA
jgi:hypothetical protein